MNRSNVFLVGFMGSGKTAVYKEISPLVKSENFDLDEEIIKKYNELVGATNGRGDSTDTAGSTPGTDGGLDAPGADQDNPVEATT